jgi:hypothetical protein
LQEFSHAGYSATGQCEISSHLIIDEDGCYTETMIHAVFTSHGTVPARAPRLRKAARPPSRTMHLVDVENLLGGTSFVESDVALAAVAYGAVADVSFGDLTVIASSHYTALAAWFGWPKARRVVRSGPNGADLALIRVIETENLAASFDRVTIASGDGIFAHPAARLQSEGVAVRVVTRPESLSRALTFAVRDVRFLNIEPDPSAAARVAA